MTGGGIGLRNEVKYINLTNGIEFLRVPEGGYRFIRIQSTACEQKRWDFIIQDLDSDFLMNLALGNYCIVCDCGKRDRTRAQWQGLEFIKYMLHRVWFGTDYKPIMRNGHNATEYFRQEYENLSDRTLKKVEYFKKFLATDRVCLSAASMKTTHDGQYDWYCSMLDRLAE